LSQTPRCKASLPSGAILKGRADSDIRLSVETVRRAFNVGRARCLAEEKSWKTAKAESKPRELVHIRRCDPTVLFPVVNQIRARLPH
jgi:hypothetical protein